VYLVFTKQSALLYEKSLTPLYGDMHLTN